jgi:hypothetical protein
MGDKYKDKAPKPGVCQPVDGVNIRVVAFDIKHKHGNKHSSIVNTGSEQVACPQSGRCVGYS